MRRILVATDGSAQARKALEFAAELAEKFEAELLVTHVVTPTAISDEDRRLVETEYAEEVASLRPPAAEVIGGVNAPAEILQFNYGEEGSAIRNFLGKRLLSSAEEFVRKVGAVRVHTVLAHGDPAKTLLSIANEDNIDTIVMGSHGMGEIRALLLGSVSNKVAHMAHCSVVLVR